MLNRITQLTLVFFASVCIADAEVITVTFSAQNPGGALGKSSGSSLPSGSLVRLGYFDLNDSSILDSQRDIGLLDEFFTVVAEVMVGFFGGETILDDDLSVLSYQAGTEFAQGAGGFAHSVTFDPVPLERDGDQLVLWAFNSDAIATATEFGIFSDDQWVTPSSLTLGFDLSTVDPNSDLYIGQKGPEVSQELGGEFNKLVIAGSVVPEPSTGLLMLYGLGVLTLRRRRRQ
ncbi:MAG: PEP-CTERM sorting domain-containing protein [Verrucomicrobia bacterium]|nr:PEP-CTERM sorting domain-containing protein [Verrucomicrobiota bacterium]